jgi:hypothetical protein
VLALAAAASISLAVTAAPAGAVVVTEVPGSTVGLQPRSAPPALVEESTPGEPAEFGNPSGNPVLHANATVAIYWDPTDRYHGDWQHVIDTFLRSVGAESGALVNVFAVDSQYTDRSNQPASYRSTFRGAYTDTDAYPEPGCVDPKPLEAADRITCLTDKQVQEELTSFISQHSLAKGMGTIYYLLTPPGVTVCLDGGGAGGHCSDYVGVPGESSYEHSFCSYHADISPTNPTQGDANTILYGMIPWTAGGLGDSHLGPEDQQRRAFDCQDGGFDPSSLPLPEKKESPKTKNAKEEEEFNEKNLEEKEAQVRKEELEGPHQEEPNQIGRGPDGGYDTGLADLIINQIAVEQQNIVTDPLLDAWQDSVRNEATDECRNRFALTTGGGSAANEQTGAGTLSNQSLHGNSYYLNDAFNLAALRLGYPGVACLTGVTLVPQFTAPTPVNAGETVAFDGMESTISLNAGISFSSGGAPQPNYATYLWNFGDGTPGLSGYAPGAPACSAPWLSPCAASAFHSYTYGGTYEVTLTVTDVGGNSASVTHPVTIVGPAAPSPGGGSGASGAGAGAGTGSTGSTGASGGAAAGSITPTVTAAVSSHSLRTVLRRGLVVRYSVSERVTGHFDVLLARSLARRLGLHGLTATGLATGTPPQVVIGKAILVTTAGGRNTATIQFSKATASRLRRLHGVSLMLRLIVRNASTRSATVITTVTLTR